MARKFGWQLAIIALYLALALLIVGHNPLMLGGHFIGADTSDVYEMARNVWYFRYALLNGEPLFFQTLLGYPDGIDGSILMTVPLQYQPMTLLSLLLPLPVAYNAIVLLYMALNGWAMYWLARYLLADDNLFSVPALLAGLAYMAFPMMQAHLAEGHAGLMAAWPAPLYLWTLLRLIRADRHVWRWGLLAIVFFYLTTAGHILQSIYVLLPVTAVIGLMLLVRRDWPALLRVFAMGAIASLLVGLVIAPAILEATTVTAYTGTQGYVRYAADALAIVTPSFLHPVYDALLDYPRRVLGINIAEGAAFIGIIGASLAALGVLFSENRRTARWFLLMGFVAWILSLGPLLKVFDQPVQVAVDEYTTFIPLPFALLQQLPGFELARTPGRFNYTLALALAALVAYGAGWFWRRFSGNWRYAIALLMAAGILFEYQSFWPQPLQPAAIPQAIHGLRDDDTIRAVFNVPQANLLAVKEGGYLQTAHGQPLIAGQITRITPVNPAKLAILENTLNPALLNAAGADIVIVHHDRASQMGLDDLRDRAEAQLGAPIYSDERIAVYRVPFTAVLPQFYPSGAQSGMTGTQSDVAVYLPQAGWLDVSGTLAADERGAALAFDGVDAATYDLEGEAAVTHSFYLPQDGYHTLSVQASPPCPPRLDPALVCREIAYDLSLTYAEAPADLQSEILGDHLRLVAGSAALTDRQLTVRLHWETLAAVPDTDVRFVHVVDSSGEIVAQSDQPLGELAEGVQRGERLFFDLTDLPAGNISVRVGWYDFNTLTNYSSADGQPALLLDTFTLR